MIDQAEALKQTDDATTRSIAKVPMKLGGKIAPLIPTDIDQAWRYAQFVCAAGWAPKSYQYGKHAKDLPDGKTQWDLDPSKVLLGILHGMEVGFTPIAALQSIAIINGTPCIWGDGALALVQDSGLLEDYEEKLIGAGTSNQIWRCTAIRRGRKTPIVSEFSWRDVLVAGLDKKEGPWQDYPVRMQKMRARAFCIRDGFADVLRGLHITEEVQDYTQGQDGAWGAKPEPRQVADTQAPSEDIATEVAAQMARDEARQAVAPRTIEHAPETPMGAMSPGRAETSGMTGRQVYAKAEPEIVREKPVDTRMVDPGTKDLGTKQADDPARQPDRAEAMRAQQAEGGRLLDEVDAAEADLARRTGEAPVETKKSPPHVASQVERAEAELKQPEQMTQAAEPKEPAEPPGVEPELVRFELAKGNLFPWLEWFKAELFRVPVRERPHFIARYSNAIDKIESRHDASWKGLEAALANAARSRNA